MYESAKVILIKEIIHSFWDNPENINALFSHTIRVNQTLGQECNPIMIEQLKNITALIMDKVSTHPIQQDIEMMLDRSANKLTNGLYEEDECELTHIIDEAVIYADDKLSIQGLLLKNSHHIYIKKFAFIKLFMQGIVPVNSEMAHYAIRCAAHYGRVWALEFLIKQGVPINPPAKKNIRRSIAHVREEDEMSPLEIALKKNRSEAARVLQEAGAQL